MESNAEDLVEDVHHLIHKLYVVDPDVISKLLEDRASRRKLEEAVEMLESLLG